MTDIKRSRKKSSLKKRRHSFSSDEDANIEDSLNASQQENTFRSPSIPPLRHVIPEGFAEADDMSCEAVCKEQLNDQDELWLIKMPVDFEINNLKKEKCTVNGNMQIKTKKESDQPFIWELSAKEDQALKNSTLAAFIPSKKTKKLSHVGNFKGEMTIRKTLSSKSYIIPDVTAKTKIVLPEGLRQRFTPFGADSPTLCREAKSSETKSRKKKKKKDKKHKKTMEINSEQELDNSFVQKKKKKKKHKE